MTLPVFILKPCESNLTDDRQLASFQLETSFSIREFMRSRIEQTGLKSRSSVGEKIDFTALHWQRLPPQHAENRELSRMFQIGVRIKCLLFNRDAGVSHQIQSIDHFSKTNRNLHRSPIFVANHGNRGSPQIPTAATA